VIKYESYTAVSYVVSEGHQGLPLHSDTRSSEHITKQSVYNDY